MLLQRPQRLRGLHAQQQQHGSFSRGSQCACRPKQQQLRSSRCRASQPEAEPASAAGSMMPPLEIAGSAPAPAGWGPQQQQPPQQAAQPDRQGQLPDVDWSRYHLQVLFVDSTDQLRARLAAGLFDKVAEWNGYGRALYSWTAGTRTAPAAESLSARAGLMAQAAYLGIPPKLFARPPEPLELTDLDLYDVVVALDSRVRDDILARVEPAYVGYYSDKVRLLSDYAQRQPLADADVLATGGLALLPRRMSTQLSGELQALRAVVDAPRPSLSDGSAAGVEAWNWMVLAVMLGAAGLVRYLIDVYPPDLPEYDPL